MDLEQYLNSLPRGGKRKLAGYADVTTTTVTKWSKPHNHPEKIFPNETNAKKIENFSIENYDIYGFKTSLEEILGEEIAQNLRKDWSAHGER